jgi:hypothetical protein
VSADLVVDARRDIEALGMLDYDAVSAVVVESFSKTCTKQQMGGFWVVEGDASQLRPWACLTMMQ